MISRRLGHSAPRLPREVRDTFFLLAVIAWVIAPHAAHLPLWCSLMAASVLLWRGHLAYTGAPLPTLPVRVGLLLVALLGTWISHKTWFGREGGVTLAVVLLSMKTLELRAQRDAFVVFFFGFFIIITHFLFSQSLPLALAMLLGLWGLLAALVNAHMPAGRPPLLQTLRTAGGLMLLGAPIMAALFMLFPRFAPLWGMPGDQAAGKTGLSDHMQVGQVASLALDDRIALRLKFFGAPPPKSEMYLRGPVLSDFDGQEWRMESGALTSPLTSSKTQILPAGLQSTVQGIGTVYRYQVTQEPSYRPWLLALDVPTAVQIDGGTPFWQSPDLQLLLRRPASDLLRYTASSQTQYRYGADLPLWQQQRYSALPAGSNPRTVAWVQTWLKQTRAAQPKASPAALSLALSDYLQRKLHDENYRYTLDPGVFGRNSADEFWFDRRQGFCEHIASSYVIAMRAAGVPARIVTGYQGAEENPLDGSWVVRNSDAHAWAEIWLPSTGWQREDPTAAIAPWRVDKLQRRLSAPPSVVGQLFSAAVSPTLLMRLRDAWDASNNAWNQWVLDYSQTRQLDALKKLGFASPSWESLIQLLGGLLAAAALLAGAYGYWQKRHVEPWLRLLLAARARLAKMGIATTPHMPPRHMAQLTTNAEWQAWLLDLEALRYGKQDAAATIFASRLQALRQRLHRLPVLSASSSLTSATTLQK